MATRDASSVDSEGNPRVIQLVGSVGCQASFIKFYCTEGAEDYLSVESYDNEKLFIGIKSAPGFTSIDLQVQLFARVGMDSEVMSVVDIHLVPADMSVARMQDATLYSGPIAIDLNGSSRARVVMSGVGFGVETGFSVFLGMHYIGYQE